MLNDPQAKLAGMVQQTPRQEAMVNRILDTESPIATVPQQPSMPDTQPPSMKPPAGIEPQTGKGFLKTQEGIRALKSGEHLGAISQNGVDEYRPPHLDRPPLNDTRAPGAPTARIPKPDPKTPGLPAIGPVPRVPKFK